jgi:hypothetical protein
MILAMHWTYRNIRAIPAIKDARCIGTHQENHLCRTPPPAIETTFFKMLAT